MDPAPQTQRRPVRAIGLVPVPAPAMPAPPLLPAPIRNSAPITTPVPPLLPATMRSSAPITTPVVLLLPAPIRHSTPMTTPVPPLLPATMRSSAPITTPVVPLLPAPIRNSTPITTPVPPLLPATMRSSAPITTPVVPLLPAPIRHSTPITTPVPPLLPAPMRSSAPITTPVVLLLPAPIRHSTPMTTPVPPLLPATMRSSAPITTPVVPLLPAPIRNSTPITTPVPPLLPAPMRSSAPITTPVLPLLPVPISPAAPITAPVPPLLPAPMRRSAPITAPLVPLLPAPIRNSAPITAPVLPLLPAPIRRSAPITTPVVPLLPVSTGPAAPITAPVPSAPSGARRPGSLLTAAAPIAIPTAAPPVPIGVSRPRTAGPGAPLIAMPPRPAEPSPSSTTTPRPAAGGRPGAALPPSGPTPLPPPEALPQKDKTASEIEDFRVHIVTWNVGSAVPPDDIISLFGPNVADGNFDMYVVGLQEVNSMINKRLKDVLFADQWSELCMDTLSRFGYVLVTSQRMQGVLLLVFSKYSHLPFLRGVQTESTRTGLGGYWGNKGGVSARMTVFGHPVCFLNCHLPAHMQKAEQRMDDFETILQQQFQGAATMGVLDHSVVFWFGDLNFRIEGYDTHVVKSSIDNNTLSLLWERDQLNMVKQSAPILKGFMEGPLVFPPTYKFDVGTHTYDTSAKKRKPAWTDRILWRLRASATPGPSHNAALQRGLTSWLSNGTKVTQHAYRSHMGFTISDHKPVSAIFSLQFSYRVDVPLVTLMVEEEWCRLSDAAVRFKTAAGFSRSSSDWIGLYKVGFRHHKDFTAYVWVKQQESDYVTQEHQVTFSEEDLPKGCGEYILGYYSNNTNTIVGVTEPFQIQLPTGSPRADSSSEDDSTLVLLQPQSRSPSPRSRSRSPALPSLKGMNLRPRSRDAVGRSPSPRASAKRERLLSSPSPSSASPSPSGPARLRSPGTPGIEVSAPEALIAAIMGPASGALSGGRPAGESRDVPL